MGIAKEENIKIEVSMLGEIHKIPIRRIVDSENNWSQKTITALLAEYSDLSKKIADNIRIKKEEEIKGKTNVRVSCTQVKKFGRKKLIALSIEVGTIDGNNGYETELSEKRKQIAGEIIEEFDREMHQETIRLSGLSNYVK
jgi:hypothetical protein